MNRFNKDLVPSNSINEKIYEYPIRQSLNISNNILKPNKFYPKTNIPLYKNFSLFSKNKYINNNTDINHSTTRTISSMSHLDFHNHNHNNRVIKEYGYKEINLKYRYKRGNKVINNSIEKDLEMMKIQMSCDLVTHKINQIKNKVQNLHEASIKDDKNLINNNIRINFFKKLKSDNIYLNSNKNYDLNNLTINTYKNKRPIFMDFSKVRNKKFMKICNDMSKEINNTFNNRELNSIDNTFRTMDNNTMNNAKIDLNKNELSNRNIKISNKNNLKYLLLNPENNGKQILNNNKFEINSNRFNNINNIDTNSKSNNINNIKISDNNKNNIINPYNNKNNKKLNKALLIKTNNNQSNNFKYLKKENNINNNIDKVSNRKIMIDNKEIKNDKNIIENNKNNNNQILNRKFGSLDKYFISNEYNTNNEKNIKDKNLYKIDYQNNTLKLNKNIGKIKIASPNNESDDNTNIKIEENVDNNNKLLLYSNLEKSKQGNYNWKNIKNNINKNNYIQIQTSSKEGKIIGQNDMNNKITFNNSENNKKIIYIKNDKNNSNNNKVINNNKSISYVYLKNNQIKNLNKINDNNKINEERTFGSNNISIPQNNQNNGQNNINDNNFKININNISNYSIKNNCLNINNSTNNNKNKNNNNNIIKTEVNIEESNKKENDSIKLTHNYSKDDLIITSEKVDFNYTPDNDSEEKEKNINIKNNNDLIKRNMTFEKDEILLDSITEEEFGNSIEKNNNKRRNVLNIPSIQYNKNMYKHKDRKIRLKHKDLCHKFTDNPQHFFTVKLNEMMLKALNISTKENQGKK